MSNQIKMIKFLILLLGLGIVSVSMSAKLKIHRCVLSNGTLSFQEKKCAINTIKTTQSLKINKSKKTSHKAKPKSINKPKFVKPKARRYQKSYNVDVNDKSTQLISDRVKSFNISIQGLKKWSLFKKVYNNKLLHLKFLDEQVGEEISLRIDFIFPDNKRFSEDELSELVYLVGSQYVNSSREDAIILEKMKISNGNGIMATFTNVSKSKKYRYTTRGAVFKGKWLIQFTLLSTNINSFSHQFTIRNLFNSLQITQ